MRNDFARIITYLRKERHLSQKQVATDLGISQALLSHYEKGVRECGLDFLVSIADYYDVSCDYLLGRTYDRQGAIIEIDEDSSADKPFEAENEESKSHSGSILAAVNKKIIIGSLNIIFNLLQIINSKSLITHISDFLFAGIYKCFRIIFSANKENPQNMFSIDTELYSGYCDAFMTLTSTHAKSETRGKKCSASAVSLNGDEIASRYPENASSLFNLISAAEKRIKLKTGGK